MAPIFQTHDMFWFQWGIMDIMKMDAKWKTSDTDTDFSHYPKNSLTSSKEILHNLTSVSADCITSGRTIFFNNVTKKQSCLAEMTENGTAKVGMEKSQMGRIVIWQVSLFRNYSLDNLEAMLSFTGCWRILSMGLNFTILTQRILKIKTTI